jgi:hypothetical protein
MASVPPFVSRRIRGRRYCVLIEMTYAGGRLDDDPRQMLTAEINVPGARADRDLVVTMSPDAVSIVAVSATVDAANPRAALALVDEALDRALMTTGLFEEFDVTGEVLRVAPLERWGRIHQATTSCNPESRADRPSRDRGSARRAQGTNAAQIPTWPRPSSRMLAGTLSSAPPHRSSELIPVSSRRGSADAARYHRRGPGVRPVRALSSPST